MLGPASASTMRDSAVRIDWNSSDNVWWAISAMAPAISTPVGPPPTMTEVSIRFLTAGSASRSATSYASSIRARTRSASSSVFRAGANCAHSGWPKYELSAPAATMR
jgi:hypothetical protein